MMIIKDMYAHIMYNKKIDTWRMDGPQFLVIIIIGMYKLNVKQKFVFLRLNNLKMFFGMFFFCECVKSHIASISL